MGISASAGRAVGIAVYVVLHAGPVRCHHARQDIAGAAGRQQGIAGGVDVRHLARAGNDAAAAFEQHGAVQGVGQGVRRRQAVGLHSRHAAIQ